MDWSTNPIKLARAKANVGATASEEQIKAEYVRLGGGLAGVQFTEVPAPEVETTMPVVKKEPKKVAKKAVKKSIKKK